MRDGNKGNTVGSLSHQANDPVTTESKDEIATPICQMADKSKGAITRRPLVDKSFCFYISGYVDGEGCFTISISKRPAMKLGWELRPSFSVSQNYDRASVLEMIREYFNCGTIRPDRSDKTVKCEVRSLPDLVERILPHFVQYPLLSEKQESFSRFRQLVLEMWQGDHLNPELLHNMLRRATMINDGKRRYLFREDIV